MATWGVAGTGFLLAVSPAARPVPSETIEVRDAAGFRQAVARAKPGSRILLAPGEYTGGFHFRDLHGTPRQPILIAAADPSRPPRFSGGGSALQLSDVSHLELRDLAFAQAEGNGLNIDDGGTYETPSHHVTLRNLRVSDLPSGNNDGIKLSGLEDFRVLDCTVERWGGSGVDMVGCHRGVIEGCTFREGGDSGVQGKGGTSDVAIRGCRFENFGGRGVNVGGSTGLPFFRPPVAKVPAGQRYEARNLTVEGCTFSGGEAPVAFVGVDGAVVRFNTIVHPRRWALRILQETRTPDFVPCRNGLVESNLVVFRSDQWFEGGVNVGSGTRPETFRFRRNFWFCSDRPERSAPKLPTPEAEGIVGQDPRLQADYQVAPDSPARRVGAHAFRPKR
jgi:hypothetical protein